MKKHIFAYSTFSVFCMRCCLKHRNLYLLFRFKLSLPLFKNKENCSIYMNTAFLYKEMHTFYHVDTYSTRSKAVVLDGLKFTIHKNAPFGAKGLFVGILQIYLEFPTTNRILKIVEKLKQRMCKNTLQACFIVNILFLYKIV